MENGTNVIAFRVPTIRPCPRFPIVTKGVANENAFATYYLLLKPQFPVTRLEIRLRERAIALLALACIALSACATWLARANALAGIALSALCVIGVAWRYWRVCANAIARERAFFFTTVRAPEDGDVEHALLPYICAGWEIYFLERGDPKRPAGVLGDQTDLKPHDLLDAIHDTLPDEQRVICASRTYEYVPNPLDEATDA